MGTMCVIGKVLDLIEASCAPHDFKNELCRCIFFCDTKLCTLRQLGALKFRKPYKENQLLSNYSETVGPILMVFWHWMPLKC